MEQVKLEAELRAKTSKGENYRLKQKGFIPAIYYGKGKENMSLSVNPTALEKAVSGAHGMNTIIQLVIKEKGDYNVLLKDYQADSIKRNFTHADFVALDLTKKVTVDVPIRLKGQPVGVKDGGILDHVTRELSVICLPTQIPQEINVDVTELKIGQNLHLSDIKLPDGVEVAEKTNFTIASVTLQVEEVVAAPEEALAEPEVIGEKKEEGEAEEAGKEGSAGAKPKEKEKGKEGGASTKSKEGSDSKKVKAKEGS